METENLKAIHRENGWENRVCCDICDKLCIEQFYINHLKSQTHTNINRKKILYKKI